MKIGVHCSVRKGFEGALLEARDLGCETFQIFTQSPRGWKTRLYQDSEFEKFRRRRSEFKIGPLVVHSPYLPNLCTSDPALYKKSVDWLLADLGRCEKLGADYLVIHPGAYSPESNVKTGLDNFVDALCQGFAASGRSVVVLIENMAGGGRRLGSSFKELAWVLSEVKNEKRLGICFDTCHAMGAGYDLSNSQGVDRTLSEFDKFIGLERIKAFHVNDSKDGLGSRRDRHEHIGEGSIGSKGFKALFSHRAFSELPLILETPKIPAPESDLKNMKALKSLTP